MTVERLARLRPGVPSAERHGDRRQRLRRQRRRRGGRARDAGDAPPPRRARAPDPGHRDRRRRPQPARARASCPPSRAALALPGSTLDDIDVVELNEAFAGQVLACCDALDLDPEPRVRPRAARWRSGTPGALAARCSRAAVQPAGARRAAGRYGLAAIAVGGGQGVAVVVGAVPRDRGRPASRHRYGDRHGAARRRPSRLDRAADRRDRRQRLRQVDVRADAQRAGAARPPGTVRVDGLDPATRGREVRRRVGFCFTDPDAQIVMPTVAEDVAFGLRRRGLTSDEVARAGRARRSRRTGWPSTRDHPAHLLSGGQKQLLALASVLVTEPDLLVMDEPTTLLDLRNARRIARRGRRPAAAGGAGDPPPRPARRLRPGAGLRRGPAGLRRRPRPTAVASTEELMGVTRSALYVPGSLAAAPAAGRREARCAAGRRGRARCSSARRLAGRRSRWASCACSTPLPGCPCGVARPASCGRCCGSALVARRCSSARHRLASARSSWSACSPCWCCSPPWSR